MREVLDVLPREVHRRLRRARVGAVSVPIVRGLIDAHAPMEKVPPSFSTVFYRFLCVMLISNCCLCVLLNFVAMETQYKSMENNFKSTGNSLTIHGQPPCLTVLSNHDTPTNARVPPACLTHASRLRPRIATAMLQRRLHRQ